MARETMSLMNNKVVYSLCSCGSGEKYKFCCFKLEIEAKLKLKEIEEKSQHEVRKILVRNNIPLKGTEISTRFADHTHSSLIYYIPYKMDIMKRIDPIRNMELSRKENFQQLINLKWEDFAIEILLAY